MINAITEFLGGTLAVIFGLAYGVGGFIGAVYWAIQGDLLNVVLSIFIPLYGAITVIWDLLAG